MTAQNWPIHIILQPHLKSDFDNNSVRIKKRRNVLEKADLRIRLPFCLLLKMIFLYHCCSARSCIPEVDKRKAVQAAPSKWSDLKTMRVHHKVFVVRCLHCALLWPLKTQDGMCTHVTEKPIRGVNQGSEKVCKRKRCFNGMKRL